MDCENSGPTSIDARGLFPNPEGPEYFNTPDHFFARMMYPNGIEMLLFASINERIRLGDIGGSDYEAPADKVDQLFGNDVPEEIKHYSRNGIMFIGDKGRVFVNRGGLSGKAVNDLKDNPLPADAWHVYPSTDHMANFFDCVKTRKQPCTPVPVEHRTSSACHLANLSLRLKRKLTWDPVKQEIVGDAEANTWLSRPQRAPYKIEA
jgi:hypothetical protein